MKLGGKANVKILVDLGSKSLSELGIRYEYCRVNKPSAKIDEIWDINISIDVTNYDTFVGFFLKILRQVKLSVFLKLRHDDCKSSKNHYELSHKNVGPDFRIKTLSSNKSKPDSIEGLECPVHLYNIESTDGGLKNKENSLMNV